MCLKLCFYQESESGIEEYIKAEELENLGFELMRVEGGYQSLLAHLSKNKVNIIVADATNVDKERFNFVLGIVRRNFCKNILLIAEDNFSEDDSIHFLCSKDRKNFDLKFDGAVLDMKQELENKPSKQKSFVKNKICEYLIETGFNNKLDGFKYYVEAVYVNFSKFPYKASLTETYSAVADIYQKSTSAVEKSMRSALISAIKQSVLVAKTIGGQSELTYDMNNKMAISMLVNKLVLDKEIKNSLDDEAKNYIYQ